MSQSPGAGAAADRRLLRRIEHGDAVAFAELFDRHGARAYRLARSVCRDDERAEDAVQDAFMSIWRRPATYDESRGPVSAWVLGVVRNRAIDQTRRNKHHDRLRASEDALELHPAAVDVGEQVATRSDADEMRSRLALLPEAQREVIVLAYYGQLTHEEIAVHLHIPPGTVKGRIRLALAKLRAGHRDFAV